MEVKKITVFCKNYVSAPELQSGSCVGCTFKNSKSRCDVVTDTDRINCAYGDIICKLDSSVMDDKTTQVTYTEEQIRRGMELWYGYSKPHQFDHFITEFITVLKKYSDPEYAKYIELQKKFG